MRRAKPSGVRKANDARPLSIRLEEIKRQVEERDDDNPQALLEALGDPESVIRQAGAWGLGVLRDGRGRSALEASLDDPATGVRAAAAQSLGFIGRPESREPLERALHDPAAEVRVEAAGALKTVGDVRSLRPLLEHLHDDDPAVRWGVTTALGKIGSPPAFDGLLEALGDPDDRVRRSAVLSIGEFDDPRVADVVRPRLSDPARRVRIAAAVVLGWERDVASVDELLEHLRHDVEWVWPSVLIALGRIGDPRTIPAIADAAEAPRGWLRVCAVRALAEMHAPNAGDVCRRHLTDPVWSVRGASAELLGGFGTPDDLPRLLERLEDVHPFPRRGAIYALARLKFTEATPRIREELHHPDPEVRLAAIWALGWLRDDGAREALVTMLRQLRPSRAGVEEIYDTGDNSVRLVSDAEARLFDTAVQAIGRLNAGEGDPLLRRALTESRARVDEEDLERPARLPTAVESVVGARIPTLAQLFDEAIPLDGDDDEIGC